VYYLWNTALISGFVAAVVSGLEPVLFFAAFTVGVLTGAWTTSRIGAAVTHDELRFRNSPFGPIRETNLSEIFEIKIEPTWSSKRFINFAMIRNSSGWHRVAGFAVAGDWGWSFRTRDEPELAKGVFAELIRATGLTVKGVELNERAHAVSKRT
jgi:hypothetical protein